jgi:uncharacterized SAM-binding protein YcdF (DUF218 family)
VIKKIFSCILIFFAIWLAGLMVFVSRIPTAPNNNNGPSDAIVILTGGAGRLEYGLQLFAQGKGKVLYISGVSPEVSIADILRKEPPDIRNSIEAMHNPPIALGHRAENTIGNAEETGRWLRNHHYQSIRLVTSNYHMPRSVSEFNEAVPEIAIIPEPVFTEEFPARWWENSGSRLLLLSEYHKFLASKLRHWIVSVTHRSA